MLSAITIAAALSYILNPAIFVLATFFLLLSWICAELHKNEWCAVLLMIGFVIAVIGVRV